MVPVRGVGLTRKAATAAIVVQSVFPRSKHEKRSQDIVVNAKEQSVCAENYSGMDMQKYSPRILLVEDDAAIRRLTSCALRHAGFEVVEACTADEGVKR